MMTLMYPGLHRLTVDAHNRWMDSGCSVWHKQAVDAQLYMEMGWGYDMKHEHIVFNVNVSNMAEYGS